MEYSITRLEEKQGKMKIYFPTAVQPLRQGIWGLLPAQIGSDFSGAVLEGACGSQLVKNDSADHRNGIRG